MTKQKTNNKTDNIKKKITPICRNPEKKQEILFNNESEILLCALNLQITILKIKLKDEK